MTTNVWEKHLNNQSSEEKHKTSLPIIKVDLHINLWALITIQIYCLLSGLCCQVSKKAKSHPDDYY